MELDKSHEVGVRWQILPNSKLTDDTPLSYVLLLSLHAQLGLEEYYKIYGYT